MSKLTILRVFSIVFIVACLIYTVVNYAQLSHAEGWGVVFMVGLTGIGCLLYIADIILRNVVKNKVLVNIIGLIIAIITLVMLIKDGLFLN